ncbi:MAG: MipA/OmpV family protein [Parvularcula sp.]
MPNFLGYVVGGLAAVSASVALDAAAQDGEPGLKAIGIGVAVRTQPYLAFKDDATVNVIPSLVYDKGRFWVQGKQVGLILTDPETDGPWELSAILDYRFEGYSASDSPALVGMEDRDGTLEGGAVLTYNMGEARLVGQGRGDLLDTHGGFDLIGQAEYDWRPAKYTLIRPYAGIQYRAADQADYYFGVREGEALATIQVDGGPVARPAYAPGETINPFVGVTLNQALSRHLAVSVYAQHDFFPDEIKDSPIVDADGQTWFGIVLVKPLVSR